MSQIPIKIKKNNPVENTAPMGANSKLQIDLKTQARLPNLPQKKFKPMRWILLIFVIIVLVISIKWFLKLPEQALLSKITPQGSIVFSQLNQEALIGQIAPFNQAIQEHSSFSQWAVSMINSYLDQTDLIFTRDIQPLFQKDLIFALFPPNQENDFPFTIILQKQAPSAQINRILGQIEQELKKNYSFSSQIYRQIKTTKLKPLSPPIISYYYIQTDDYLIIANSIDYIEKTIDLIIKND